MLEEKTGTLEEREDEEEREDLKKRLEENLKQRVVSPLDGVAEAASFDRQTAWHTPLSSERAFLWNLPLKVDVATPFASVGGSPSAETETAVPAPLLAFCVPP